MLVTNKLFDIEYNTYRQLQIKLREKRKEVLIFLEHSSTITAGKNFHKENLLVNENYLFENKIDFYNVERGGDLTAHEKGQLVIYPHIDLQKRNLTIGKFLQILNSSLTESIEVVWDLEVYSHPEKAGIYLKKDPEKKILSQGVFFKSFFTSYGIALNLKNDLKLFQLIHPCGGESKNIVSIQSLGLDTSLEKNFISEFKKRFLSQVLNTIS
jgi:lipoyl(octanoyl) transferase